MTHRALRRLAGACLLLTPVLLAAGQTPAARPPAAAAGMVDRIFKAREFSPRPAIQPQWFDAGASYLLIEPDAAGRTSVIRYDSATGARREVLISAAELTPAGAGAPLEVEDLSWSQDARRALVFTNTRRVWRTNSRGDYWLLDRPAKTLKKVGAAAPEASLMYAQFSPDASRVGYVRDNDIYVEDVATGATTRLTTDGSDQVINGGSDWVNEEELDLHDCFRWSPDGTRIAFWQFDLHGVGNFPLVYYLGQDREIVTRIPYPQTGPYPRVVDVPYPLAGTTNSAVRAGVVDAHGGPVTWMSVPGDPREHYIARLQWADARSLLIQQLNRLQNTTAYLLADAASGSVREMWRDRDAAFITIGFGGLPEALPLREASEFLVLSEKDGWMHAYRIARDGGERLVTRGAMDALSIAGSTKNRAGCISLPHRPTRPNGICTARRSMAAATRSASPRPVSRVRTATPSRPTAGMPFTGSPVSTTRGCANWWRCRRTRL
jgi:dipeptidyl-peptidase 4